MPTIKTAVVVVSLFYRCLLVGNLSVLAQPSSVKVTIPMNAATMGDNAYSPNPIDVNAREGVTWTNNDTQIHTVTSGNPGAADAGSVFDSGTLSPGATYDFVFDKTGAYDYYCQLHPQMVGTVNVS